MKSYKSSTAHMGMKQLISENMRFELNHSMAHENIIYLKVFHWDFDVATAIHARFESTIDNALADAWRMCANSTDDYD